MGQGRLQSASLQLLDQSLRRGRARQIDAGDDVAVELGDGLHDNLLDAHLPHLADGGDLGRAEGERELQRRVAPYAAVRFAGDLGPFQYVLDLVTVAEDPPQ